MSDYKSKIEEIGQIFSESVSENSWAVLSNENCIIIISDTYGVAVITYKDLLSAKKSALNATKEAEKLGINIQAYPFTVDEDVNGNKNLILSLDNVVEDVKSAMSKRIVGKKAMKLEEAEYLMAVLWDGEEPILKAPEVLDKKKELKKIDIQPLAPEFKAMIYKCAEKALGDNAAWVAGVEITLDQLVAEDFMLGPLLLVASENWTSPYLASKKQGGFVFSVVHDPEKAVIGYRVTGIHMASPLIVLTAISAAIRKLSRKGACIFDPYLLRYANFIDEIVVDENMQEEVDTVMVSAE